jgi:hypothetical protein
MAVQGDDHRRAACVRLGVVRDLQAGVVVMAYTMHTSFVVHVSNELGDDGHDIDAKIAYTVSKGYPDTWEEPGCGPSVSIHAIYIDGGYAPGWLIGMAEEDEALAAELLAHAADTDEHARDQAADARRDDMRTEQL